MHEEGSSHDLHCVLNLKLFPTEMFSLMDDNVIPCDNLLSLVDLFESA